MHASNDNPTTSALAVVVDGVPGPILVVDAEVVARVEQVLERGRALQAITLDTLGDADGLRREVASLRKGIEASRVAAGAAPLALTRAINDAARTLNDPLGELLGVLTRGIDSVNQAVEAERRQAERVRLEAERRQRDRERELAQVEATAKPEDAPAVAELRREVRDQGAREYMASVATTPIAVPRTSVHAAMVPTLVIFDRAAVPIEANGIELRPIHEPSLKRVLLGGTEVPGARMERQRKPRGGR